MTGRRDPSSLPALAGAGWDYGRWAGSEPKRASALKERLLRGSLEMVRGRPGNEDVCREVVEQALEARLFEVAREAVRTFSDDAGFHLCVSISKLLEPMRYWAHLDEPFVRYCEERALGAAECRSAIGWGGHYCDQRSRALGFLGRFRFFTGRADRALDLWDGAGDARDVDEVIARMCGEIVEHAPDRLDAALALLDLMLTTNVRAKTMAGLAKHV
jgi:hypothetical protein